MLDQRGRGLERVWIREGWLDAGVDQRGRGSERVD
jgi:hypothetical protein